MDGARAAELHMSSEQKTVLTVDDSKVVHTMVARALERYGCRIIEAANGQEAVEAAEQHRPDLILLDMTMPVMDGRQALAAVRGRETCRRIPVIMLTDERTKEIIVEIARLALSGYLLKPFDQQAFDREVGKVLGPPIVAVDRGAVLVVDDSERVLTAARAALESAAKVLTAANGQEAVERYVESRPGVVVIDLAMPGMDGFETLARIQQLGRSACIAVTVRGDAASADRARKAGYRSVLPKPFQPEALLEAVRLAQDGMTSAEELAKSLLEDDGACSVLAVPESTPARLTGLLPALRAAVRGLAEDGGDKLVIDLEKLATVDADAVKCIGRLAGEAAKLGLRIAVCSPEAKWSEELKKLPGLASAAYAANRDAARLALAGEVAEAPASASPPPDGPAAPENS
jgi:CheY-like chemotaxis protein